MNFDSLIGSKLNLIENFTRLVNCVLLALAMAFLLDQREDDLIVLADDLAVDISPTDKGIDIITKIRNMPNYDESTVRNYLYAVVEQRKTYESEGRYEAFLAKLKAEYEAPLAMAFLLNQREDDLIVLADDLAVDISPTDKGIDIITKINMSNYDELTVRNYLYAVVEERQDREHEYEGLCEAREHEYESERLRLLIVQREARLAELRTQRKKKETQNLNADLKAVTICAQQEVSFPIPCVNEDKPVIRSNEEVNADNTSADVTVVRGSQKEGGILTTCLERGERRIDLGHLRGERENSETGEDFKRNPEIPTKEVNCPVEVSYQVDKGNEIIGLGSIGEPVEMFNEEIVSFDYASNAVRGRADAKSEMIQGVNHDSVEPPVIILGGKVNNDVISENLFATTQPANVNELVEETLGTLNVETAPLEIENECKTKFCQGTDSRDFSNEMSRWEAETVKTVSLESQRNWADAKMENTRQIDCNSGDTNSDQEELGVDGESKTHVKCKMSNVKIECKNRKLYRCKSNFLFSIVLRRKHYLTTLESYLSSEVREKNPSYLMFEMDRGLLAEHFLDPGEKFN